MEEKLSVGALCSTASASSFMKKKLALNFSTSVNIMFYERQRSHRMKTLYFQQRNLYKTNKSVNKSVQNCEIVHIY